MDHGGSLRDNFGKSSRDTLGYPHGYPTDILQCIRKHRGNATVKMKFCPTLFWLICYSFKVSYVILSKKEGFNRSHGPNLLVSHLYVC